ncbi:hypothetical protein D3C87_2030240 [compost metagenome]
MPTANHNKTKKIILKLTIKSEPIENAPSVAKDGKRTNKRTATISSTTRIPKTKPTNLCPFIPSS